MVDISTPNSSTMSIISNKSRDAHREVREMPYRLRHAVAVYLENKQFLEGFTLLNSILVAGRSTPSAPPVFIPPPSYFELAATLVVHPLYTTRARSIEHTRAADEALRFLRDTCAVVGPVAANLASAFQFYGPRAARRKRKRAEQDDSAASNGASSDEDDGDDGGQRLRSAFVGERSVFRQRGAEGFWDVVGWAFNCSVRHRGRWARWRLWLEVMIDALEHDFVERLQGARGEEAEPSSQDWERLAREALIAQYLVGADGRGGRRRVVGAILADGGDKAMREFGEVWKDETKERKKVREETGMWDRKKKINLDEDEWGDYGVNEDEDDAVEEDEGDVAMLDRGDESGEPDFGGVESMKLRQRLLILLTCVSNTLPHHFTYSEELYDVITEHLRPLPLPVFRDFLATLPPEVGPFPPHWHIALLANTLLPFLAAPPRRAQIFALTQQDLIKHYLPHAANATSTAENAKMSLLIEHILFYMLGEGRLEPDTALKNAVEKGIRSRAAKATGDARKKDKGRTPEEQAAKGLLDMSAERIRLLMDILDPTAKAGTVKVGITAASAMAGEYDLASSQLSELTDTPSVEEEDDDDDDNADRTMLGS